MTIPLYRLWTVSLCALLFAQNISCEVCKNEPKCRISRTHGMRAADCYGKDFKTFPKCVPSNVEILDLSYNRLRKINRNDLRQFSGLRILYLGDNLLFNLDDDTFLDLQNLKVLDLGLNALATVPTHIFQLPSLERLFLKQNLNMNLDDALEKVRPIYSPLTVLDLSFTTDDDNVPEFPNLGILPHLVTLNITGNKYSSIRVSHFAGLCKMEVLASANVSGFFENDCDCWKINVWLNSRRVAFVPLQCPITRKNCPDVSVYSEDQRVFEECNGIVEKMHQDAIIQKSFIGIGATLCILFLIGILYMVVVRRKRLKHHVNSKTEDLLLSQGKGRAQENVYT